MDTSDQIPALGERDTLTEPERSLLAFEGRSWRDAGAKEQAIRMEFGITAARYYQKLNALIDSPAAARYDPMLVSRLRRMRFGRVRERR